LAHVIGAIWLPGLRPYSEASLSSWRKREMID
jgi:hypothetical protein